jgi:acetyl-CoA acetyltransferase
MAKTANFDVPTPVLELSRKAAIVGVGETDYGQDYQASRAKAPGYEPPTLESMLTVAFERALADAGLKRSDIDGLSASFVHGGPSVERVAEFLGVKARALFQPLGIMAGPIPEAAAAIAAGECDTVVLIYAAASRANARQFGGHTYDRPSAGEGGGGEGGASSYFYYHPWGFSSQAAHWSFTWRHYMAQFGKREEDLGAVALQLRKNALANPKAIMQTPITIEDYMASRYIVRPLHLLDICLVNDGAVCLILRRADMVSDLPHKPVLVAGWGEATSKGDKLHNLVRERLRPQFQDAGGQAFRMAGFSPADIQHFEGYDASSIHLVNHLEGHDLVPQGQALDQFQSGELAPGGRLPVNVAGGMLSEAYMHGWNHVAEITRQLRHEAGPRQIPGVEISMYSLAQTDRVHPLIFVRGS